MTHLRSGSVTAFGVVAALALVGVAYAATSETKLKGTVGSEGIRLVDSSGAAVTRLDPGPVELELEDTSEVHNFHLTGPGGVNVSTGIDDGVRLSGAGVARSTTSTFVGTKSWRVVLEKGTLTYRAEPQGSSARKTVAVG